MNDRLGGQPYEMEKNLDEEAVKGLVPICLEFRDPYSI